MGDERPGRFRPGAGSGICTEPGSGDRPAHGRRLTAAANSVEEVGISTTSVVQLLSVGWVHFHQPLEDLQRLLDGSQAVVQVTSPLRTHPGVAVQRAGQARQVPHVLLSKPSPEIQRPCLAKGSRSATERRSSTPGQWLSCFRNGEWGRTGRHYSGCIGDVRAVVTSGNPCGRTASCGMRKGAG
ncbi:hypothetical protein SAFG77S_08416 [Streptomyces afghaniensis]